MIKKILVVLALVVVVIILGWMRYHSNAVYDGAFSDTDPTGKYKISLVAISDELQDNALEIADVEKNELVMSIPPEMLVNRIEAVDKSLDRNTAIYIAGTAFQEGNLGPWTKDGLVLWGKLKRDDVTMYKYYRIDLLLKELKVTSSIY